MKDETNRADLLARESKETASLQAFGAHLTS